MSLFNDTISRMSKGEYHPLRLLITPFALLTMVISIIFFAISIGKPHMGITLSLHGQVWSVESVDTTGAAGQSGINVGDRPVEINGQPAETFVAKYAEAGMIFNQVIKELSVTDERGQVKSVVLKDASPPLQSLIEQLAWLLVSIVFWTTGAYVIVKRPQSMPAFLLWLFSIIVGLALAGDMAAIRGIPGAIYFEVAATVIGPWLLMHFFLVLPEERTGLRKRRLVYLIYLPAGITLILFPLIGYADGQPVPWFRSVRLLEYGVGFLAAVGVAFFNYFSAVSARTRQQMKIVSISCFAALIPLAVLYLLPEAILRSPIIPPGTSILLIVFIPLGLSYAVVTQRLMDIDVVIRRGIIYAAITLVMTTILSLALFAVLAFPDAFGTAQEILLVLAAGGLATILFGPTEKWVEVRVDRLFYKDRYDYRQIIDVLSNSLKLLKDPVEISRVVVGTAVRTLNLAGACFFVKQQSGDFAIGACQGTLGTADIQDKLSELTHRRKSEIEFPNPAAAEEPELQFIIPLVTGEKAVGILFLSPKASRQEFSSDDMYLLQGMASVGAMALHSAMLIRDVSVRDTFVSIASHELRTPLTAVIGYSDLLLHRDPPEATRKQWLQTILDSGTKIAEMADELLDVSRIRSGRIALKIEKTQLPSIISEQAIAANPATDKHNFVLDIAPNLNEVYIDRNKFSQVLANLLNNAVKYSPNGGRITLSARNDNAENRVIVSVTDEGLGISPADKESLFQTFHRIQRQETISIRGIGLGLCIVKEWTEAMGGKVWFDSELNKGSTFYVALPTRPPEKFAHAG